MPISNISPNITQALHEQPRTTAKAGQFSAMIKQYIIQQNQEHHAAGKAAMGLIDGSNKEVSQTLLAIQKANLSFQLMLTVRNKLVTAYHDVMRMQI